MLVDHPRRALRSVGGLKHVTRRYFAWLRWPTEAEAGPEILRAYKGPSRLCVGQFVPRTGCTWPIWWGGLEACWATMVLCSLPETDVIFEWSSTWPWGLVGSPRHCPRASTPIFWQCGALVGLVQGVILGTKQLCLARAGRTPDGACDPESGHTNPEEPHITCGWEINRNVTQLRHKWMSEFRQILDILDRI